MTKIDLLKMLEKNAQEYRNDKGSLSRNVHMHDLDISELPIQKQIDAVLIDFINFVGVKQGIDYGLYMRDFLKGEKIKKELKIFS